MLTPRKTEISMLSVRGTEYSIVPSCVARYRLGKPGGYHGGDRHVVLFEHHHVAVTSDADVDQLDKRGMHPCLLQEFHRAMIVIRMIGSFRGHDEGPHLREIWKKSGWWLLHPTSGEVGRICRRLSLDGKVRCPRSRR